MGSNIANRSGVPWLGIPIFAKVEPYKPMPLVFMTRGEREARSSKFYPGALKWRFFDNYPSETPPTPRLLLTCPFRPRKICP